MAGKHVVTSKAMLHILLFIYCVTVVQIYNGGNIFSPDVLDIDKKVLIDHFLNGVKTSISLALKYPNIISAPQILVNAYKNLISIMIGNEYAIKEVLQRYVVLS